MSLVSIPDLTSTSSVMTILQSSGPFSFLLPILLMTLGTALPILPIPTPTIEAATGIYFGFWEGLLICLVAQVASSLYAFFFSRRFGVKLFGPVFKTKATSIYQKYLNKRGPLAVFILRLTLASPFNIVSFGAGLTKMEWWKFALATFLGTIPEVVIFSYLGSRFRPAYLEHLGVVKLLTLFGLFFLLAFYLFSISKSVFLKKKSS